MLYLYNFSLLGVTKKREIVRIKKIPLNLEVFKDRNSLFRFLILY